MNHKQRRAARAISRQMAKERPKELTAIAPNEWPAIVRAHDRAPMQVWVSQKYLVQSFPEPDGVLRLSVCRTTQNGKGRWDDGLSWDELQDIKRQVGYGDAFAVEIYPRDKDIVNVANFRHLWLLPFPLFIGWTKE